MRRICCTLPLLFTIIQIKVGINESGGYHTGKWWKRIRCQKGCGLCSFTKEEAIAFGDSTNDTEMLQAVGTGIAMDNASQDVKAVADVICGSVREEEIYRYCKENHLI